MSNFLKCCSYFALQHSFAVQPTLIRTCIILGCKDVTKYAKLKSRNMSLNTAIEFKISMVIRDLISVISQFFFLHQ